MTTFRLGAFAFFLATSAWPGQIEQAYSRLPLAFEANHGQAPSNVDFLARGNKHSLSLSNGDVTLGLAGETAGLRMKIAGARNRSRAEASEQLRGRVNYVHGTDASTWRRDIPTFGKVLYRGIYPGIDLVYYGNQGRLEYDFVVSPYADPNRIRLRFDGMTGARVDSSGDLVVRSGPQEVRFQRPVVFQAGAAGRERVEGRYALIGREVAFRVGRYDRTRPLIIDPVLVYSTLIGWSAGANGMAVDRAGNMYIAGWTSAVDFPLANAAQRASAGGDEAFVAKLNPEGTELLYSTFIGGSAFDQASSIAVDSAFNAYVAGQTFSGNFPSLNASQRKLQGVQDGFVLKLDPTGKLLFSTFLGGSDRDEAHRVALDSAGNPVVAGVTYSSDFPQAGAVLQGPQSGGDAFVTVLSPAGQITYSTHIGGSSYDSANAVAADNKDNIYVAGVTCSSDFQATPGAYQTVMRECDAFVTAFSRTSGALYSTLLGGGSKEDAYGVAADGAGGVYVAGNTWSTDFATTDGSAVAGPPDVFLARFNSLGNKLVYSTVFGGARSEFARDLVMDANGNAYIAGQTSSPDFPSMEALQPTVPGPANFIYKGPTSGAAWSASDAGAWYGAGAAVLAAGPGSPVLYTWSDSTVYRSFDGGGRWLVTGQTKGIVLTLAVDPSNPAVLYCGGFNTVEKSSDGGATWVDIGQGLTGTVRALLTQSPNSLLAATDAGLFRSTDGGGNWTAVRTSLPSIRALAADPTEPAVLYAGTNRGLIKSADGGHSWSATPLEGYVDYVSVVLSDGGKTQFARSMGRLYRSTDATNWVNITPGRVAVSAQVVDERKPGVLYAAIPRGGLRVSTDYGQTWAVVPDSFGPAATAGSLTLDGAGNLFAYMNLDTSAFVAKFDRTGTKRYVTQFGGTGDDDGRAIATNGTDAWLSGQACSPDFPLTAAAYQHLYNGCGAFAARMFDGKATLALSAQTAGLRVQQGSGVLTAEGTIAVTAGARISLDVLAQSDPNFLTASLNSATTPATLTLKADATGLAPGVYRGTVTLTSANASNSPHVVNVTLTVLAPTELTGSMAALEVEIGETKEPAGFAWNVALASPSPLGITASVATGGGVNFLSAALDAPATPSSVRVAVDATGLAQGTYTGAVTITPAAGAPLVIPVTLKVTPPGSGAPKIAAGGVVNGASFAAAPVSPGSIASIFGVNLAAGSSAAASDSPVPALLGDVSVTVNGIAAPLFYVSGRQINFQVPYETAAGTATVVVTKAGIPSDPVPVTVAPARPGIFLLDAGRAAALNQDYSVNSQARPAAPGSVVMVYATGLGEIDSLMATGMSAPMDRVIRTVRTVEATIGGSLAAVQFAGLAPGFVGLMQVNLVVPVLPAGVQPVVITVNGEASNAAVIAVGGQ